MSKRELADIDCELLHETDAAYLIDTGEGEAVWVPKSQSQWDQDSKQMTMPMWLAVDKGLV